MLSGDFLMSSLSVVYPVARKRNWHLPTATKVTYLQMRTRDWKMIRAYSNRRLKHNLTFWHRSFTFNSNKPPTWCNNFSVYYPDVCLQLNMFRAFSRPSSGAQWLQWQPLVLPSYRGDSRAVFVVGWFIPLRIMFMQNINKTHQTHISFKKEHYFI